jgi:hypothetical protein
MLRTMAAKAANSLGSSWSSRALNAAVSSAQKRSFLKPNLMGIGGLRTHISFYAHHTVLRGQIGRPIMRKLITTIALLALVDSSVAIAQTVGSRNPAALPSTNSGQQLLPDAAPVGHRQPRADQVPPEKNLMDPNDPFNRENAALDRMINGICRGC